MRVPPAIFDERRGGMFHWRDKVVSEANPSPPVTDSMIPIFLQAAGAGCSSAFHLSCFLLAALSALFSGCGGRALPLHRKIINCLMIREPAHDEGNQSDVRSGGE